VTAQKQFLSRKGIAVIVVCGRLDNVRCREGKSSVDVTYSKGGGSGKKEIREDPSAGQQERDGRDLRGWRNDSRLA